MKAKKRYTNVRTAAAALIRVTASKEITVSNVLAESILLAMARNINKLHNKIQKGRTGTHLFSLKSA